MEALDQLLMACHSQSIKPFVESFLHMVAKLLESGDPQLQVLGTNSFANIEEDTPSYHRRYDFFVSRFSAMIRIAGIRGIQGVVRKTVNDELRATIWEPQHMDKIVPSLLFNMQKTEDPDGRIGPPASPSGEKEENPAVLAENCFRELLARATYGNMSNAVRPAQYSHHVIQEILAHLDSCKRDSPRVRAGIIQVLLEAVAIAAKGSIGQRRADRPERHHSNHRDLGTRRIQIMLLRSLLMVTSGYNAKSIASVLSAPFLDPLLSTSLMEDSELRQLVLEILHNLIDRHDNRAKLRGI
ncbi:Protein EFR3-like B, partial [Ophiophagus hannah]